MKNPRIIKIHAKKEFLNKPFHHSDALIYSEIKLHKYPEDKQYSSNIELKIKDCGNSVRLDFNYNNQRDFNNALKKVDILIRHLGEFRQGLIKSNKLKITKK